MINKKSKAFKNTEEEFSALTEEKALQIMTDLPKTIRRPILFAGEKIIIGFNEEEYQKL